jgi:hypothetical protein
MEVAFLQTPDCHGRLELIEFHTPAAQGGRQPSRAGEPPWDPHLAFAVEDISAPGAARPEG